jgi:aryl-alcohol dehydrogenase-like predicted oxidoreductase
MELILGTAQLARRYGVASRRDPGVADAVALLQAARALGVTTLDTAPAYGAAESLIGVHGSEFAVHTKLDPALEPSESLRASLARLGRDQVDVVHLHDPAIVTDPSDPILAAAAALVSDPSSPLAGALGASVYTPEEFDAAVADSRINVIQAPVNLLDRRLSDVRLRAARAAGTRVLARSVLLQGLLARPAELRGTVPALDGALAAVAAAARTLGRDADELALGWVRARPGIDGLVVGVEDVDQLRRLVAHLEAPMLTGEELDVLGTLELPVDLPVDPRTWTVTS